MARKKPTPDPAPAPAAGLSPAAAEPTVADPATTFTSAGPETAGTTVPAAAGETAPAAPNPFPVWTDAAAGVCLRENRRFRQAQLVFRDKPSDAVRGIVREAGFRWHPEDRAWVKPIDRDAGWKTRLDAERVFQEVVDQIAHERGEAPAR